MDEIPNLTRLTELLGFSEQGELRLAFKREYKEYWVDYWGSWPAGERDCLDRLTWSADRDICADVAREFLDTGDRFERYWGVENNVEGPWDWDKVHGLLTQFFFRASGQRKRWQRSKLFESQKGSGKQAVGPGTSDAAHASDSSPTMAQASTGEMWARPEQPETRSSAAKSRAVPADPASSSPRMGSSERGDSEVSGGAAAKATHSTHRSSHPVGTKRGMFYVDAPGGENVPLEKRQRFTVAADAEGQETTSSSRGVTVTSGQDAQPPSREPGQMQAPSCSDHGTARSCLSETAGGSRPQDPGGRPRNAALTDPNQAPMAPMTPVEQPEPSETIRAADPLPGTGEEQGISRTAAPDKPFSAAPTPLRGRAVLCTFLLVISRAPQYVVEWEPRGRFSDMSLAEMVADLPLRAGLGPSGLMFTLVAPDGSRLGVAVPLGQEERFAGMKRKLARKMKSVGKRDAGTGPLGFDVLVEAVDSWRLHDDVDMGTDDEGDLVWPGVW